jgi:hypothetical protein
MTVGVAFSVGGQEHTVELDDDYPNATYRKGEQIVAEIEALGYQWTDDPPDYAELADLSRQSPIGTIDMGDVSPRVSETDDRGTETEPLRSCGTARKRADNED